MLLNEENDMSTNFYDVFVEKAKNIYAELVESDEKSR